MHRLASCLPAIVAGSALCLLFSGCASTRIKRLSGSDFVLQAKRMEQISSFQWTAYVGRSAQRAYLETGHPAFIGKGVRTTVYWTPLAELPLDVAGQIQAGTPSWQPPPARMGPKPDGSSPRAD